MNVLLGFYAIVHILIWSVAIIRCGGKRQWASVVFGLFFVAASVVLLTGAFMRVL